MGRMNDVQYFATCMITSICRYLLSSITHGMKPSVTELTDGPKDGQIDKWTVRKTDC